MQVCSAPLQILLSLLESLRKLAGVDALRFGLGEDPSVGLLFLGHVMLDHVANRDNADERAIGDHG